MLKLRSQGSARVSCAYQPEPVLKPWSQAVRGSPCGSCACQQDPGPPLTPCRPVLFHHDPTGKGIEAQPLLPATMRLAGWQLGPAFTPPTSRPGRWLGWCSDRQPRASDDDAVEASVPAIATKARDEKSSHARLIEYRNERTSELDNNSRSKLILREWLPEADERRRQHASTAKSETLKTAKGNGGRKSKTTFESIDCNH